MRLFSLILAPFAFGTSAFVFVGLIEPISNELGESVPAVGQLQTVFALACGLGGPVLARLLSRFDRKSLLILVMLLLTIMNVISALATDLGSIAIIRLICGFFAGLTLPLATTIAVNMVPELKRPYAIAMVLGGYTLAFMVGMPVGSMLGDFFGWRSAFWFAGSIAMVASIIIAVAAPKNITSPVTEGVSFRAALKGENIKLMSITLLSFLATFATVAFIGPVITRATGLEGASIGGVQIAIGVGSLLGLPIGAALSRKGGRPALLILFAIIVLTQVMFTISMLFDMSWVTLPFLLITMALSSAALFATSPVIQTRLAESAGPAVTIAFALNGSMIFFGQGLGAILGGAVISTTSIIWLGACGALVAIIGVLLIMQLDAARN
jgi:DHA1 family inner membrane transport protein